MLIHTHTHSHSPETHSHTCRHTHSRKKCAICGLALWTYGAVYIDLLVWVAMQCNNRYVFWRMTSLSLVWATLTYTRPQATNVLYMRPHWHVRITWTLVHTHGNGRNMQLECLKMKVKGEKNVHTFLQLTSASMLYITWHESTKPTTLTERTSELNYAQLQSVFDIMGYIISQSTAAQTFP